MAMNRRCFVNGRLAEATEVASLDQENLEPNAPQFETLVQSQAFIAFSLPNCPQCDELRAFLGARGVPPSVFVKWDKSDKHYPALKGALGVHAGDSFTFPQVFAHGEYQGGFKEAIAKAEAGAYDDLFEEQFGAVPATVQRWVDKRSMVVFSLPNCPQCDVLRSHLEGRGLPVADIFIKLDKADPWYQSLKAQLIKITGRSQFTFPQTFIGSNYEGDFDDVIAKSDAGQYNEFFAEKFGIALPAPRESAAPVVMEMDDDF